MVSQSSPLPVETGGFFGRADDLAEAERLVSNALAQTGPRLVSVVGPGGVGKTRFCIELLSAAFRDADVAFVDLTPAATAAGVLGAVAEGLAMSPEGSTGEALQERILEAARLRPQLLVFIDSAEHVREHVAKLVETLLDAVTHCAIIVTSREPLGAPGEYRYELVPLEDDDAMTLFVERAQAARPDFALTEADKSALRAIVDQLSCLPLTIELAAARIEVLSLTQLHKKLARPFALLKGDDRRLAERHRTLLATLTWSWDLLDDEERRALCWCAVFHGPFSLERAEAVFPAEIDVMDVLQRLKRKSLLSYKGGDQNQFYFLESIKAFARDRLQQSGEHKAAHTRHADGLVAWAGQLDPHGDNTLGEVREASEDLIAAIVELTGRAPKQAAALLKQVHRYLRRIVVADTAMQLLDDVNDALSHEDDFSPELVAIKNTRAQFAIELGQLKKAEADTAAVLENPRAQPDDISRGQALGIRAALLTNQGEFERARADLDGAEKHLQGHPADLARVMHRRFVTYLFQEDYGEAERIGGLAQMAVEKHGDPEDNVYALVNLAYLRAERGQLAATKRDLLQAHALAQRFTSRTVCGIVEINLAWTELDLQNREAALRYCDTLADDAKTHGLRRLFGLARFLAGIAHAEDGRQLDALQCFLDAESHQAELDTVARARFAPQAYRACVLAHLGRDAEAKALLDEIRDHPVDLPLLKNAQRLVILATEVLLQQHGAEGPNPQAVLSAKEALMELGENTLSGPLRIARRWLIHALHLRSVEHTPAEGSRIVRLTVDTTGAYFRVGDTDEVDIHRRGAMRRVLAAMVEKHRTHPGDALSLDDVFAAGWPGQTVTPGAAANRVYTVIRNLRRAGLDDVLVTRDDGYLINPMTAVTRKSSTPA